MLSPATRASVYAIASVGWLYRHISIELGARRRDEHGGLVAQVGALLDHLRMSFVH